MKLGTLPGTQCLFCSVRPRLTTVSGVRGFTSTSVLARKITPNKKSQRSRNSEREWVAQTREAQFPTVVEHALNEYKKNLDPEDPQLDKWTAFARRINHAARLRQGPEKGELMNLKITLFEAFRRGGQAGVLREIGALRQNEELTAKYESPNLAEQKKLADLRYPAEWYPHARAKRRTIHLHVGPTNSGKTYRALKRLEEAQRGFYAGPLRLLAQEVYSRFTADGISCGLITGDEVRLPDTAPRILSNTVEMVNLNKEFDVGVIDEIQMIADSDRGWAWTRAFMGTRVQELHVCGETRAVPLIKELVSLTGDDLKIHRYERLNPLKAEDTSLRSNLKKLRKGDCIVSFSRIGIHALKNEIEKATGKRAAIIYGGLPAEIRTQQASLFNDPDNDYDFLVASDAIGMGLNLKCRRVIFQTLIKRGSMGFHRLTIPEIKQIGGRAGRYRAANEKVSDANPKEPNIGLVTSLEEVDLPYIREALDYEPPPLRAAGVLPNDTVFQRIANYFPYDVSFKFLINRVMAMAEVHPLFFLCRTQTQLEIAGVLDKCHDLSIDDRLVFMAAPFSERDNMVVNAAKGFVRCVSTNTCGRLLDIPELNLHILEVPVSGSKEYMTELESLHKSLILYLWLSYRTGGVFTDRTLATHVKEMVEERMMRALAEFSANKKLRIAASARQKLKMEQQQAEEKRMLADAGFSLEDVGEEDEVLSQDQLQTGELQTAASAV